MEVLPDPDGLDRLFVSAPEWEAEFEVFGSCPVQALGTIRGCDIYFRARHDHWSFDVADRDGNLPSDGFSGPDGFYCERKHRMAGWMPLREAVAIIEGCLRKYNGQGAEPSAATDRPREARYP